MILNKGESMLNLIVRENGQLLIGETTHEDNDELEYIILKNVIIVNLVQNHEGVLVPVPADYPHPYLDTLLTIKKFESLNEFNFKKSQIHYFIEDDMNADIVGWYKSVQANKSCIQITSELTDKSKSNIILN